MWFLQGSTVSRDVWSRCLEILFMVAFGTFFILLLQAVAGLFGLDGIRGGGGLRVAFTDSLEAFCMGCFWDCKGWGLGLGLKPLDFRSRSWQKSRFRAEGYPSLRRAMSSSFSRSVPGTRLAEITKATDKPGRPLKYQKPTQASRAKE